MSGLHESFTQGLLGLLALSRNNSDAVSQKIWKLSQLNYTDNTPQVPSLWATERAAQPGIEKAEELTALLVSAGS